MATKGIEVVECSCVDGIVLGKINVRATIKTGQDKDAIGMTVNYSLMVNDPIKEVLEKAASTWRIDLAKVRDQGIEAIQALDGQLIFVGVIPSMTSNATGTRQVNVDKMSDEQAQALLLRLQAKLQPKAEEKET